MKNTFLFFVAMIICFSGFHFQERDALTVLKPGEEVYHYRGILPLICVLLLSACGISQNAVDSGGSEPAYHTQALKTSVSLQEAVETFYYIAVVEMDSDPEPAVNQGYWQ